MTDRPPVEFVVPVGAMTAESEEEKTRLLELGATAERYISGFRWCRGIAARYCGNGIGGVVGVFLFRIVPGAGGVDEWLWVIVGDIPPAYLVLDGAKSPSQALALYIREMSRWVSAVETGCPADDLIPVNVPATREHAATLRSRLAMLKDELLPRFREDEAAMQNGMSRPN